MNGAAGSTSPDLGSVPKDTATIVFMRTTGVWHRLVDLITERFWRDDEALALMAVLLAALSATTFSVLYSPSVKSSSVKPDVTMPGVQLVPVDHNPFAGR